MGNLSKQLEEAKLLAEYIDSLNGFSIPNNHNYCYYHMGATLSDLVLQAGLNYRHVVKPRIENIIIMYSGATTTSSFYRVLLTHGANIVLNWNHPEKPRRLTAVTEFFISEAIEKETELQMWLNNPDNCFKLLKIHGIGLKSVDYLKNLVNIPSIAVDRHIRKFVSMAGLDIQNYSEIQDVVQKTANIMSIEYSTLDHAIWQFMSETNKSMNA